MANFDSIFYLTGKQEDLADRTQNYLNSALVNHSVVYWLADRTRNYWEKPALHLQFNQRFSLYSISHKS